MDKGHKLPSDFFESLKDELILPFRFIKFGTINENGRTERRLLARRGDVNNLPFKKARVHFVQIPGKASKEPIRCGGKVCALCEWVSENYGQRSEERAITKYLFYELVKGEIGILSLPPSFFSSLFGEAGRPSEIVKALQLGNNVFDPVNGNELIINRETFEGGIDWHIAVGKKLPLNAIQIEDLKHAEALTSVMTHLTEMELIALKNVLDKKTRELPAKLKR